MKGNKKILIVALILGLATVFALSTYIKKLESVRVSQGNYTEVIVAANTIPANVKITGEMLSSKSLPSDSIHPEAFKSTDKVIGGISKIEIVKGEQILSSKVVVDGSKATLAYRVPESMRAISIPTSEVTGVAGYINVGDKVDILVTYADQEVVKVATTFTQIQNIKVLAVGNAKQGDPKEQTALPATLTLLVNPEQAEVLVYALNKGTINLTLRNPADTEKFDSKAYSSDNFGTYKER